MVLSGDPEALADALSELAESGVDVRRVAVDYASHSDQVEAVRDHLAVALADLSPAEPTVPFHSTVTEGRATGALDGGYWYRNLRQQVRFGPTIDRLLEQGFGAFVEVSPHPCWSSRSLRPYTTRPRKRSSSFVAPGRRRARPSGAIDGRAVRPRRPGGLARPARRRRRPAAWVDLPTYPFERQHFWRRPVPSAGASGMGLDDAGHPLLGALVRLPESGGLVATGRWSASTLAWCGRHRGPDGSDGAPVRVPEAGTGGAGTVGSG
ncbi:hypothetical protein Srubr_81590 [Streptomyces rubradiris]|uniref:Malonyl-CoA:ACP transacylase (MAT) domain-containing protein n=1 Tax=Streptomyces rubradiris TaxID=285531 RepID=A0ABQ3RR32_STRRR|nr:hypothetical protein Srubr_81590 [Streptomyces rubradiris]